MKVTDKIILTNEDCIVKRYGVDDRNLKELNVKKVK